MITVSCPRCGGDMELATEYERPQYGDRWTPAIPGFFSLVDDAPSGHDCRGDWTAVPYDQQEISTLVGRIEHALERDADDYAAYRQGV